MKAISRFIYTLSLACAFVATTPTNAADLTKANRVTVFNNSSDYSRIPAIVKLSDGRLMAFSDYRPSGGDIGGGVISIVAKTSSDNGATWSDANKIISGNSQSGGFDYAHGDAAVVVDRESGKILLMCASGKVGYGSSSVSNNRGSFNYNSAIRIGRYYSSDNGASWSGEDITSSIYGIFNTSTGRNASATVSKAFFASGRICQSKTIKTGSYYRLYAALTTNQGALVIYSDDFGGSWSALGGTSARPSSSGDESKLEELPNGNVLLSCRSGSGRYFNIYTYTDASTAAGSWGTAATASDITAANCNGEIMLVPAKCINSSSTDYQHYSYVALQSVPASSSREKVSIYYKALTKDTDFDNVDDFTSGWTQCQVSTIASAYSTMTLDKDGNVAFLFEENANGSFYDIKFLSTKLSDITSGNYGYCADLTYDTFNAAANDWVGKVLTMRVRIKFSDNKTTDFYIKDSYDETNGVPKMEIVEASKLLTTLDKSYYWVVSKDPGTDYYYLSNFNGDGYLGEGAATDYATGETVSTAGVTCTGSMANEYEITEFTNSWTGNSAISAQTLDGYAMKFKYTGTSGGYRVVAVGVEPEDNTSYELNFFDHTSKGETTSRSGGTKVWSTDFIFEEVEFKEATDGKEKFVTDEGKPAHSGFPVKFTRHSDDYVLRTDCEEDFNRYSTLMLPYATELPAGVTAYKVSSLTPKENTTVGLEKYLESKDGELAVLPRETPVLLVMAGAKGDGKVQTTEFFHPALARPKVETGLKGVLGKKILQDTDKSGSYYYSTDDKDIYVLSKKKGRVAFYWLSKMELAANKAYYKVPASQSDAAKSGLLSFVLLDDNNNETTSLSAPQAITTVEGDTAAIYDLQGRRVAQPTKGLYIKGGKKYIVK